MLSNPFSIDVSIEVSFLYSDFFHSNFLISKNDFYKGIVKIFTENIDVLSQQNSSY